MSQTKFLLAATAVASLIAGAASAATIATANGTPLTYMVMNTNNQAATSINLVTKPGSYSVIDTSSSVIDSAGSGGGFAQVFGGGGVNGVGFADITVTPQAPITGMSAIKFKIEGPSAQIGGTTVPNGWQTTYTFDAKALIGGHWMDLGATTLTSEGRYVITAGAGESISAIELLGLTGVSEKHGKPSITNSYNFTALKQVSFDGTGGGVPEPASWSLMILGVGAVGASLRARRKAVVA